MTRRANWLLAFGATVALAGCSAADPPRDPARAANGSRRVVVVVPGITGVELIDPDSGDVAWGRGANLLGPRDRGYRLALALADAGGDRPAPRPLQPGRALESIRIGPIVKPVYGPVVHLLETHGWRRGSLETPAAGDDLFLYAYDWRRDNAHSAVRLAQALEALARRRGGDQRISLVCQSNGAHVCRYLLKFGSATPEQAAQGDRRPPVGVRLEQLVLIGNANGGSLRILRFLNRGRSYVPVVGRRFAPETFFTFESLYQDLPAYRDDLFVDASGRALDIDLYDPANWRRYGWSVYSRDTARRLERRERPDLFGDGAARAAHLERQLSAARRFQTLLRTEVPVAPTRLYLIQNRRVPTPDRAVLVETPNGWVTLITGDRALERLDVHASVAAPGDGHATTVSQEWLSAAELEAFGAPPFEVDGGHFEMILERPALDRLLAILGSGGG